MARTVLLPLFLFVVSVFLSIMSVYAIWACVIAGAGLCLHAFLGRRREARPESGRPPAIGMRAGIALLAASLLTVSFMFAAFTGLFGSR